MKTAVHARESFPWGSWEHCYENCSACHGVFPLSFLGTLLWKLRCMSLSLSLELPGNVVMKTAVHVIESFPWASWEHCYENCSACHGVFPLSFLGTLLWKLQCIPWSLALELPENDVMKTAVLAIEFFPWSSWECCYENCSACNAGIGVFPLIFLGTLLWDLQCLPWSLSLEFPGSSVMKTAVNVMESFPWASWDDCYENCSACYRVFPLSFMGTLLWKLQCMPWSLSLWTTSEHCYKTAVHATGSFPWVSLEHCHENNSACHGIFPFEFPGNMDMKTAVHAMESYPLNLLGTLLWKLQCISWCLSLERPGNVVMKTLVHAMESFPWASWEHCYENCSACHEVFPFELPGNIIMKTAVPVMESFPLNFLGTLLWKLQCMSWSLSLWDSWEHCYENSSVCHGVFLWTSWEHCYEICSAWHGVFPLNFHGTLLCKL